MKPFLGNIKDAAQFGVSVGIALVLVEALPRVISTKTLVWDWNYALLFLGALLGAVAYWAFLHLFAALTKKHRLR